MITFMRIKMSIPSPFSHSVIQGHEVKKITCSHAGRKGYSDIDIEQSYVRCVVFTSTPLSERAVVERSRDMNH